MLAALRTTIVMLAVGAVGGLVGGIAGALIATFILSPLTGFQDLSFVVVMFSYTLPIAILLCGVLAALAVSPLRQTLFGNWRRKLIATLVPTLLVATGAWSSLQNPQFFLDAIRWTDNHDPNTRGIYIENLIALGPRSIEPVVAAVRQSGTHSRSSWQLNVALKGLGRPAHQQLLHAIDGEETHWKRVHLIDSLQEVFNDYSRLPLYLRSLQNRKSGYYASFLQRQLSQKYEELVPSVFTDYEGGEFNPDFVDWYQRKSAPNGVLPRWKP